MSLGLLAHLTGSMERMLRVNPAVAELMNVSAIHPINENKELR